MLVCLFLVIVGGGGDGAAVACPSFFLLSQLNWTCNGSWHHSLFGFASFFVVLLSSFCLLKHTHIHTLSDVCDLCAKFIPILMYSKNPSSSLSSPTDDSRQYYIKLLLRFCTSFPYPLRIHSNRVYFICGLSCRRRRRLVFFLFIHLIPSIDTKTEKNDQ